MKIKDEIATIRDKLMTIKDQIPTIIAHIHTTKDILTTTTVNKQDGFTAKKHPANIEKTSSEIILVVEGKIFLDVFFIQQFHIIACRNHKQFKRTGSG